jgi:hypothetical protein
MLDFDQINTALDLLDGAPVAYDLQFQHDAQVVETYLLHNTDQQDIHLYIDVDAENIPVAMSLVHPPRKVTYHQVKKTDPVFRHEIAEAYQFAFQTVAWAKSSRDKTSFDFAQLLQGSQMARDATRQLEKLESYSLVPA